MAEIAGLALSVFGTVGILGQLFDGCIKGYRVFSTASNLGRDSERLVCKIRIEETRLWVWGSQLGVADGKFETRLAAAATAAGAWGHEGMRDLAAEILTQLFNTIMDCNKLQDRYGLREEAPGSVDRDAYMQWAEVKSRPPPTPASASVATTAPSPSLMAKMRRGSEWKLRARWVIADKEKFGEFLEDLQYYNDRLEKLFPPTGLATLQRTWANELLVTAQRDVENLQFLESASQGRYPGLSTMANLKRLRINLDALQPWRIKPALPDGLGLHAGKRVQALYQRPVNAVVADGAVSEDIPVLVDWIPYDPDMELDSRLHLYQRVDNLARMLHSCSARHPDLFTLDCVGYVDDTATHRYGILHLEPRAHVSTSPRPFQSLAALIEDNTKRTPDLDVRFQLAHKLAVALWAFHSLDWLHKSFCSPNIIFFSDASGTGTGTGTGATATRAGGKSPEHHDLSTPYVLGFESARPDGLVEMTYDPKSSGGVIPPGHVSDTNLSATGTTGTSSSAPGGIGAAALPDNFNTDLYRHPSSLGVWRQPFRKAFDVYALGLLLLEIGLWKSVRVVHKARYAPATFRDKVSQALVPALGSKTGSVYRGVVERCLGYDEEEGEGSGEGEEKIGPHQFLEWVVVTLEGLRV
ncbi:prion-inhibition and propagation-domain-containing protein [Lineolata rhizophorae]|uniref:Prion-inhibition and propagation-domain-containing protein n=1 Tax=Lineolata rhizophorae TaxID=578093 RepID=A0A6A6PAA6_9PEZI|nr:prion-inhibition and propagation-domain-containing protein [Lineolata rhizophorae]